MQNHSSNTSFSPTCPPPQYPSPETPSPTPYPLLTPCFSEKYSSEFASESTAVSLKDMRWDNAGHHVLRPAPPPPHIPFLPPPSNPSSILSSNASLSPTTPPHSSYQCQPPCCPGNGGGAGTRTAPSPRADDNTAVAGHGSPAAHSMGGARVGTERPTARDGECELPLTGTQRVLGRQDPGSTGIREDPIPSVEPVAYLGRRNGTTSYQPLPYRDKTEICKVQREFGRSREIFKGMIRATFNSNEMVPKDITDLFKCLLTPSEYEIWENKWKFALKTILQEIQHTPSEALESDGNAIMIHHLCGTGDIQCPEKQTRL
ncbi:uncharacterized protein [Taeniopygia guttata]|uniref:uncharacterized protein n=1 Tax=Taeniopygia guttata TaxID=59729 RepID=UPI003BB91DEF